jgi:ketosteroid isomerase-like protein
VSDSDAPVSVSHEFVVDWLRKYEAAWRTAGTAALAEVFTEDATYSTAPYDAPLGGLDEIGTMWEQERDGPDEQFTMTSEIVAIDGDTAVARLKVDYAGPPVREYRDLWIMRFDRSGRCLAFEEWPFWPAQPKTVPRDP